MKAPSLYLYPYLMCLVLSCITLPSYSQLGNVSFSVNPLPYLSTGCSPCYHSNAFSFSVTGLPTSTPDGIPLTNNDFTYFWDFGDGDFLQINGGNPNVTHTYAQAGTYTPTLEITQEKYDDDPPESVILPKDEVAPDLVVSGVSTAYPGPTTPKTDLIDLVATRGLVDGDIVTYAIPFKNYCDIDLSGSSISLQYSSYLSLRSFSFVDEAHLNTIPNNSVAFTANTASNPIQWTFSSWPVGSSGTLFAHFDVNFPPAQFGQMESTRVFLGFGSNEPSCTNTTTTKTLGQVLRNSHDPNFEWVDVEETCGANPSDLTYRVHFQNTGTAPADHIEIEVWLADNIQVNGAPQYQIGNGSLVPVPTSSLATNPITLTIPNAQLRGTSEPGYLIDFGEDSTKGYIEFEVNGATIDCCHALPSRAAIYFDCNPPIVTNPVFTKSGCYFQDTTCTACTENVIKTLPVDWVPANNPASSSIVSNLSLPGINLSDFTHFSWFPHDGLVNPNNWQNTKFSTSFNRAIPSYFLIASTNGVDSICERMIIEVPVTYPDCNLQLTASQPSPIYLCQGQDKLDQLTLQVTGGTGPYEWEDCTSFSSGPRSRTLTNLGPGKHFFGVLDANGCYAYQEIEIQPHPYLLAEDDPGDCTADLRITGGKAPYTVTWPTGISGVTPTTLRKILPAGTYDITVTDAANCSYVVQVNANCRPWWSNPSDWRLWGLIGGAVALIGLLIVVFRRR
jgi:PKD repeat protein